MHFYCISAINGLLHIDRESVYGRKVRKIKIAKGEELKKNKQQQ